MLAMKNFAHSFLISLLITAPAHAAFFDHSALDAILQRTVDAEGMVDYQALERDHRSALESYLVRVADADVAGWPRAERIVFWINAYNARVLLTVLDRPQLKNMTERYAAFGRPHKVAGRTLSLYDIQYRILLNRTNPDNQGKPIPFVSIDPPEPRVHFALVAAAKGGPRLRAAAYNADRLDYHLIQNSVEFANSTRAARLDDGRLWVSSLLKWASKDFEPKGGIVPYIVELIYEERRHDAEFVSGMLKTDFPKAAHSFDWSLNAQPPTADVP
jgi:hypothetical protein